MDRTDSVQLMFSRIVAQHGEFTNNMRKFDLDLCKMDTADGNLHTVEEIRQFLKDDLIAHFECEEDYLFPAALMIADDPQTVQMIVELFQEHWEITHRLGYLEEKFPSFLEDGEHSGAELRHARALLQEIQEHNYRELREFYSRFENDEKFLVAIDQCRTALKGQND